MGEETMRRCETSPSSTIASIVSVCVHMYVCVTTISYFVPPYTELQEMHHVQQTKCPGYLQFRFVLCIRHVI